MGVENTVPGPIFLGVILNWILFCCLAGQVCAYYISSRNDRITLKILVSCLFLAAIVQIVFATNYAWQILVVSRGQTCGPPQEALLENSNRQAMMVLPIINAIVSASVHIFFSGRIWSLNRTTVGRIVAVLIVIVQCSILWWELRCHSNPIRLR
ncbi:hypothetical protein BD779DRAFT_744501 [Infundibulicybe gibba]|nr:hypothetical protein BD779DRAFT_744501 [Infundibulicybe gibba]